MGDEIGDQTVFGYRFLKTPDRLEDKNNTVSGDQEYGRNRGPAGIMPYFKGNHGLFIGSLPFWVGNRVLYILTESNMESKCIME